jgi:hypothetical protein
MANVFIRPLKTLTKVFYGSKNSEFDADFKSLKNVAKKITKKGKRAQNIKYSSNT